MSYQYKVFWVCISKIYQLQHVNNSVTEVAPPDPCQSLVAEVYYLEVINENHFMWIYQTFYQWVPAWVYNSFFFSTYQWNETVSQSVVLLCHLLMTPVLCIKKSFCTSLEDLSNMIPSLLLWPICKRKNTDKLMLPPLQNDLDICVFWSWSVSVNCSQEI